MTLGLSSSDWLILITGNLVAAACALPGTFLVLRRMALIGDAVSHAILPGIAIGFLLTHEREPFIMLVGAAAAGLVTVWLVEVLYRSRRLHEDSSIAVVFTAMFAVGIVLVAKIRYVHLDLDCVAYGSIELVGKQAPFVLGVVTLLNLGLILLFYKELKLCTFDPPLGQALGFSPTLIHYLLMSAVSLTTVAALKWVGAILVVAFLIVPAATAYLLTDRLWLMLILALAFGLLASTTGYFLADEAILNCSIAGAMASMTGIWFVLVWLLAPRHGLLATLLRRQELRKRFAADLMLLHLQKTGTLQEVESLSKERFRWAGRYGRWVLHDLQRRGLVARQDGTLSLTVAGETVAEELGKAYRA